MKYEPEYTRAFFENYKLLIKEDLRYATQAVSAYNYANRVC